MKRTHLVWVGCWAMPGQSPNDDGPGTQRHETHVSMSCQTLIGTPGGPGLRHPGTQPLEPFFVLTAVHIRMCFSVATTPRPRASRAGHMAPKPDCTPFHAAWPTGTAATEAPTPRNNSKAASTLFQPQGPTGANSESRSREDARKTCQAGGIHAFASTRCTCRFESD
jgi:hypothetical protein